MTLLEVRGLRKHFAGVKALDGVELDLPEGAAFGVIGPNGAGKTTLFDLVSGVTPPSGGTVTFGGEDITGMAPHRVNERGMARTFQNVRLFRHLTVFQNVLVGQQRQLKAGLGTMAPVLRWRKERQLRAEADELLGRFGLGALAGRPAGELAYADQRRLEIARALASQPRLLLLDEPAAGMLPGESEALVEAIHGIHERGCAVLLIEHEMDVVMSVCERIAVLNFGVKIAEGTPDEIRRDAGVIDAYLGTGAE